jgi:uncharacterized membrane protein YeaQ/YmgE (transglycosylase-associated protein family)
MNITTLLVFLVLGAATGWLAGKYMKGGGYGIPANILLGILGGVIGGYLFRLLVFAAGGLIGSMVTAIAGAVALLYLVQLYKKVQVQDEE